MTTGLKLALFGLHRGSSADPETLVRRAARAETIGFESFWIGDHVALPPGSGDNPAEQPRLEAVVALGYMAAVTRRVRLAIGVIVLPQRQPVLLAKQLSTIDVLSKGRLIVGIGVGYVEPELRALGASLADRGARTDEYLKRLWTWLESQPDYRGRTHLLVTTDHGRGRTPADWRDHGAKIAGAEDTWIAIVSPTMSRRGEWKNQPALFTNQIAATVARWLGVDLIEMRPGAGKPIQ